MEHCIFLYIRSYCRDFKSGAQNGVCRNGIPLLSGKGSGTLYFLA